MKENEYKKVTVITFFRSSQ